ncbi:transposase, partial [Klebsiella pneumoniae]|nr:transposase [Klebsiella pneumoniae]
MPPQRRTYSKSFEAQVIQECSEPGASIANIALGYKHRPPFAGSLPPEPHAELFHLVVAGLRSVRQAQVLVFLLDRVVSDRVHPGNGIHELPRSLSLAGSSQPGCPDGYA